MGQMSCDLQEGMSLSRCARNDRFDDRIHKVERLGVAQVESHCPSG